MATIDSLAEVTDVVQILRQWEEEHTSPSYDPVPTLQRLAEIIEVESENYLKMDPDPFDERHPSRRDPDCNFGQILKVLFKRDNFMTKLINDYSRDTYYSRSGITGRDVRKLNTAACRLMLDILPGLETSAVVQPDNDGLIHRLFSWAEKSTQPLQSYATGLLAAAMDVQDIATGFREQNAKLVPLMLQRLHKLQEEVKQENQSSKTINRPFAHLSQNSGDKENNATNSSQVLNKKRKLRGKNTENGVMNSSNEESLLDQIEDCNDADEIMSPNKKFKINENTDSQGYKKLSTQHKITNGVLSSCAASSALIEGNSNSSWAELETYVIGNVQIHPPTLATHQMLILRYLTPMGEYQEFLGHVFEHNALDLIFKYINVRETKDSRLAFEALKYLASLLCHKKFSIEFLNMGGLQKLLDVPRPSVAATGVSICLYYLAYCEDAMECICLLSKDIIVNLVTYALWLLERSHDSGKCHATMFFGCSFSFKIILEEFDAQDGLRKLFNVISTLPILNIDQVPPLNDDEECASRQIVRHVAVALKKYMEAHLYLKAEQLQQLENEKSASNTKQFLLSSLSPQSSSSLLQLASSANLHKPCKFKNEQQVQEKVETIQKLMGNSVWTPVEELYRLGGITLLLQIISFVREWSNKYQNYTISSAETVRSCLDVIAISAVVPKVVLLLCERNDSASNQSSTTMAINLLLAAAEGEIIPDSHVQRAALRAIVNCVCAPIIKSSDKSSSVGHKKKLNFHNHNNSSGNEELIQKVWSNVRSNNGIMVLLQLMMVKIPITDADSIRALACRALAGLSRSEKVRQIISKLPMFTDGQIQSLMKNPIHNEKRQEHVMFQKYALELMERVSGKSKPTGKEYEMSLVSLHRASVVAQTKIQYDDQQLYQIICQHLSYKGFDKIAGDLQKAVNLDNHANLSAKLGTNVMYNSPGILAGPRINPVNINSSNFYFNKIRLCSQRDNFLNRQNNISSTPNASSSANCSTPLTSHRFTTSFLATPNLTPKNKKLVVGESCSQSSGSGSSGISHGQPIKLQINSKKTSHAEKMSYASQSDKISAARCLQKQILRDPGGAGGGVVTAGVGSTTTIPSVVIPPSTPPSSSLLESIVTEYLTNQHALCKNPMVTCPKFNLFEPHKCPDPCPKNSAAANITVRIARRPVTGFDLESEKLDRKYIYSRFCPIKTFRPTDVESMFTYCIFSPCQQYLMLGTYSGDIKMFNVNSGLEEAIYTCHESYIRHMECNKKGDLLLTSSIWRRPLSALWSIGSFFDMKFPLDSEDYAEFSKLQDKIIGTRSESATIYDVQTGKLLRMLTPSVSNRYTNNRATFSMNDELVLSDGILWDVNSGKEIHKFDKLNQTLNGVFHPNGTEVVSNTEVWDLRTFHLLNTVPILDQMNVMFSPINRIIYAVPLDQEPDDESTYVTSFKTLDGIDYSSIGTYDVKRGIYSLAFNKYDTQIAIVENQGDFDSVQESCVKLYDVGKRRDDEDEGDEEEDDDDDDDEDDDDEEDDDEDEEMDASDEDGSNDSSDDNNAGDGANESRRQRNPDESNANNTDDANDNDNDHDNDNEDDNDDDENDDDDEDDNEDDDDTTNDTIDYSETSNLSDIDDFEILFS